MVESSRNEYKPDFVTPPGETLKETLESIGMSQRDLARRTGRPVKTINEIVKGKAAITAETALQLERVLGISASFWVNREQHYREYLARQAEQEALRKGKNWLKGMPLKEMAEYGWIRRFSDPIEQMQELLGFFGVRSPREYMDLWKNLQVSFRMSPSFQVDRDALAAWLRKGVIEAQKIECDAYDAAEFAKILQRIRPLTLEPPEIFQPELIRLCASCGVAVVFVRELPKTRTSGATRWLTPEKALIQLSLRYKSDDMLWFTFFHEAGHILLHGKRLVFLHDDKYEGAKEKEANRFAENILIPAEKLGPFMLSRQRSRAAVERFAEEIGISPGIVVGRLQHLNYLPKSHLNGLKRRYRWSD